MNTEKKAFCYIEDGNLSLKTESVFERIGELFPEELLYVELRLKGGVLTLEAGETETLDVQALSAAVSNPERVRALGVAWLLDAVPFIPSVEDAGILYDLAEINDVVLLTIATE